MPAGASPPHEAVAAAVGAASPPCAARPLPEAAANAGCWNQAASSLSAQLMRGCCCGLLAWSSMLNSRFTHGNPDASPPALFPPPSPSAANAAPSRLLLLAVPLLATLSFTATSCRSCRCCAAAAATSAAAGGAAMPSAVCASGTPANLSLSWPALGPTASGGLLWADAGSAGPGGGAASSRQASAAAGAAWPSPTAPLTASHCASAAVGPVQLPSWAGCRSPAAAPDAILPAAPPGAAACCLRARLPARSAASCETVPGGSCSAAAVSANGEAPWPASAACSCAA